MTMGMRPFLRRCVLATAVLFIGISFCAFAFAAPALSYPVTFTDDAENRITVSKKPLRVVSLVPAITEIIFRIGASEAIKGVTYHSAALPGASEKEIVGGFLNPCPEKIASLNPDMIFVSAMHEKMEDKLHDLISQKEKKISLIRMDFDSIKESVDGIRLLGKIFDRESKAVRLTRDIESNLSIIKKKVNKIPRSRRRRVIRIMGRNSVMTPGADSFQNEMIRAAGGIPPGDIEDGNAVFMTKDEWASFNPQVIYGCGRDAEVENKFFHLPGWRDVDAVKNGDIFHFPCDLTCRVSVNVDYFVGWLAASIYGDEFAKKESRIFEDKIYKTRALDIGLDYVSDIKIAESRICDFKNKTLIINFKKPMSIVSTLEGMRDGIATIGNHYTPPHHWAVNPGHRLKELSSKICSVINVEAKRSSFLFTGANMDNLSIKRATFKKLTVYALVTAGVVSNAMRMSKDEGAYYEPGTINIIIMTNMKLTPRAMTRAIITATEAKTAALLDMDVRSSYNNGAYRATGTGTDNIIVVGGTNPDKGRGRNQSQALDVSGGHTKLGELIARAVYAGAWEAAHMQNGMSAQRNIFQRLKERNIFIHSLAEDAELSRKVEEILLDPVYAGFISASFGLSDDYEKGLIKDISSFNLWAKTIANKIAGKKLDGVKKITASNELPPVISTALNAILTGARNRSEK